jgi:hypothetical protein
MALRDPNTPKPPKAGKAPVEVNAPEKLADPDLGADDPDGLDETGQGSIEFDNGDTGGDPNRQPENQQEDESKLHRVECLQHDAIINGHKLAHGHVIEMSMHDVRKHRRQGVAISDPLKDDDKREVSVDVTKPFQPPSSEPAEPVDATG